MQIKKLLLPILATVMLICGCQQNNAVSGQDQLVTASENKTTYTAQNIPEYTGSPYVELNNNIPDFQESEYTTEVFEQYSDLDAVQVGRGFLRRRKGAYGVAPALQGLLNLREICHVKFPTSDNPQIPRPGSHGRRTR